MRFSGRRLYTLLLMALIAWLPRELLAADSSEQALKAAFLYNFARYTEWPTLAADFQLCIIGTDSLGAAMTPIARKEIAGRPIKVLRLKAHSTLVECNLVFISPTEHEHTASIVQSLAGLPILTVAEFGNYDPKLVMLRMKFEQGTLAFEANTSAAKAAGLNFSAKMLHLARKLY